MADGRDEVPLKDASEREEKNRAEEASQRKWGGSLTSDVKNAVHLGGLTT
jgi:hypothetical protein